MLLFFHKKKPSDDARKHFAYQMCLVHIFSLRAKEDGADGSLDVSKWELSQLWVLIIHTNSHTSLVVKSCNLLSLITVKLRNKLKELSPTVSGLWSLCALNISESMLQELPRGLAHIRLLEDLSQISLANISSYSLAEMDQKFQQILAWQQLDQSKAISRVSQESAMQKAAFEALQVEQDLMHRQIRNQEEGFERQLVNLLIELSAEQSLPVFVHHQISLRALGTMTASDLEKIAIMETGLQCVVLKQAQENPDCGQADLRCLPLWRKAMQGWWASRRRGRAGSIARAGGSAESGCVACMEQEAQMIFLLCGHMCCCQTCCECERTCPLCHMDITQCVRLFHGG
ncbi:E3 ubiquitin-protein ligase LRSAM1 [Apteryx mantelli]|uniref:E3 ubiquitin-protein ligase LRSAM1 n=1 Tax=Apteryx mantelli TaxID=2696672 RepID=A0ABM4FKJ9_9AVES